MEPRERAEKAIGGREFVCPALKEDIAAQIEEAEREAFERGKLSGVEGITRHIQSVTNARIEGWNAAKERASGIAEESKIKHTRNHLDYRTANSDLNCGALFSSREIADAIAEMEPDR